MKKAVQIIEKFIMLCNIIGGIALVIMMTTVTFNIFYRLTGHTIVGIIEMTQVSMVMVIWMSMAYCSLKDGHIRVDIIRKWPGMDRGLNLVMSAGCIVFGVQCWNQAIKIMELGKHTVVMNIPQAPFNFITAFGFFLVAIAVLIHEYHYYVEKRNAKEAAAEGENASEAIAE